MGEIAEMMLEGLLCQCCGGVIDHEEVGYPRTCYACLRAERGQMPLAGTGLFVCEQCGKRFSGRNARRQHKRDKHSNTHPGEQQVEPGKE